MGCGTFKHDQFYNPEPPMYKLGFFSIGETRIKLHRKVACLIYKLKFMDLDLNVALSHKL